MTTQASAPRRLMLLWLLLVLVGTGVPLGEAASVSVEYDPPLVTIRITEPTDLNAVLQALCQQMQARCDLEALAGLDILVAPTTLMGGSLEVVNRLLQRNGMGLTA